MFLLIGARPFTLGVEGWLRRDEHGFLLTGQDVVADDRDTWWKLDRDPYPLESSQPGVFVAGDLRHGSIKRVASAVGEGAMAASLIHRYLASGRRTVDRPLNGAPSWPAALHGHRRRVYGRPRRACGGAARGANRIRFLVRCDIRHKLFLA